MPRKRWKSALITTAVLAAPILIFVEYRKAADFQERSDCAAYWLEKAKALQETNMKSESKMAEQSQLDLREQLNSAYDCVTKPASHSRIAPGGGSFGQHGVLPHQ